MSFVGQDIEGGVILTPAAMAAWQQAYPDEYAEYVEAELLIEGTDGTGLLKDIPEWMDDGDLTNGPFDFSLNPSQWTIGW